MKKIVTLLSIALAIGTLSFSCSKTELGEVTPPETRVLGEDEISPRFYQDNIDQSLAQNLALEFLSRPTELYASKVFDFDPEYIQYSKSFDADIISFRGISWYGGRNPGTKPLYFYASGPNTSQDITRLESIEDIYETQPEGRILKGRVYKYSASYGSDFWLMVNENSIEQFEEMVHFGRKP